MNQLLLSDPALEEENETNSVESGIVAAVPESIPSQDLLDAMLAALTQMAVLSPRRQADVAVAMRRAGLSAPHEVVHAALDRLRRDGSVERPLYLLDGGILVSVTARGIERLANTAHRHVVAAMMAPGRR